MSSKYQRQYFVPEAPTYDWVHKDHIDKAPLWCAVDRVQTVDRACKDFRGGSFSGASCSAEQIGVADSAAFDLVFECGHDGVLTDYLGKGARPPFAV